MGEESNNYVIDAESEAEMVRLIEQDQLLTRAMGGVFPEDFQPTPGQSILDLACGPGRWAQEVAFIYPFLTVVGVDISKKMTTYAQAMADVQQFENLQFEVLDIRAKLSEVPSDSFDFINARLIVGFMTRKDWPALIQQCMRILRPGGFLRLTECDQSSKTTSPAFETMQDILSLHSYKTGRTFSQTDWGITPRLSRFLRNANGEHVQVQAHAIDWSMGTKAWSPVHEDFEMAYKLMQTYLVGVGATSDEQWNTLWEQTQRDFYADDFSALWSLLSAWCQKEI
jgi:ubiquinone/menaquinone biosynthesis C-methylase UbiE